MSTANSAQARYSSPDDFAVEETRRETRHQSWPCWPVDWSAVVVGALAALAVGLLFGLIGIALGAHQLGPEHRVVDLRKIELTTLAISVFGAFLAFVVGGWIAGKIAGVLRAEPAMLHGAIVWLATVPALLVLAAMGAGSLYGGWHSGLAGSPSWSAGSGVPFERPEPLTATATATERSQFARERADYQQQVKQWHDDTPRATRNSALGALTALLLGLIGSVIGGWMASGEPMSPMYRRVHTRV